MGAEPKRNELKRNETKQPDHGELGVGGFVGDTTCSTPSGLRRLDRLALDAWQAWTTPPAQRCRAQYPTEAIKDEGWSTASRTWPTFDARNIDLLDKDVSHIFGDKDLWLSGQ
ncbi:hypothetical protein G6O67_002839 [Ophiocordyceps sinensis]|uniref:Uncharacterized protein n=2 Tax=Ophiocordyceps sinensis TaxID=72228 RepID=A0A8H4PV28_9HYPO|nr:hypothetical protein OCS_00214 [Ophiocordyceps sinensis CO18]KAF4510999.1 hypothetical protein G6O67_002839 [Ophiocordyceps sinensis]